MKIFKSNDELKTHIKDGVIKIQDDIRCDFNVDVDANIMCWDLNCWDLNCHNSNCWDLNCRDLKCWNLNCWDLKCRDLNCWDLTCGDLNCWDLNCRDLKCGDLNCWDLDCWDLNYHAHAIAYETFKCKSAKGRRMNSKHLCLDSDIEYIQDKPHTVALDGKQIELSEESYQSFKKQFSAEGEA